jgi:hypothetical protein
MTTNGLDELLKSIQLTADNAQKKMEERQSDRLRSIINVDQNGQPESLTWECRLPSGDGGKRTHEILRLPWALLYPAESMGIKELSIEFDCDIKKVKQTSTSSQPEYMITPMGHKRSDKKYGHNLKLVAQAINDFVPESTIDELPIDDFLDRLDEFSSDRKKWYSLKNISIRRFFFLLILIIIDITIMLFTNN